MSKREDIQYAVLIVSGSEQFDVLVRKSLPAGDYMAIDTRKSAASARQWLLERYYNLVIIDGPLSDEPGTAFAMDVTEQCHAAVLFVVSQERYHDVIEQVSDDGVLVLAKPFPRGRMNQMLRYLMAVQRRFYQMEKQMLSIQEKMEELRIVSRAKLLLVQKKHLGEDEAHRLIGKEAMDHGISRRRAALNILDELE